MIKKIIGLIIFVAILAVGFEVYLNLSHYNTEVLFQYQPEFGWSHFANKNFWYNGNLFSINQDGFRDIDHFKEKPAGVTRIAFMSSHYLRGTNSAFENLATTILEKDWNQNNEQKIEVFNFAIPKYNLGMAHFLIKKFSQGYGIDYFFYFLDPQKDPMAVADNSDVINYAPRLIVDEQGLVKEKLDFEIPPSASAQYQTLKSYQFLRKTYNDFKNYLQKEEESDLEMDSSLYKPYPEIYFDEIATSTAEIVEKMAKMMDYIIDNNQTKIYIILSPPQHSQFFEIYEQAGNLAYFSQNNKFVDFIEKTHGLKFEVFMAETKFFISQVENNHFEPKNLGLKLNEYLSNQDRLIDISDDLLPFGDTKEANGFFHNWHRRDTGQAYFAKVLREKVLPRLLTKQN